MREGDYNKLHVPNVINIWELKPPGTLWATPGLQRDDFSFTLPGIFPGDKGGRCVGLTTLPFSCADCLEIWEPQPPGTLWVCPSQ